MQKHIYRFQKPETKPI